MNTIKCWNCEEYMHNNNKHCTSCGEFLSEHGLAEEGGEDITNETIINEQSSDNNEGMSKTSKILIGLAGASIAACLIATGIYYPMKVLNRKRSGPKRKTKKNRRSKIKK